MKARRWVAFLLFVLVAFPRAVKGAILRVCLNPDNLPFSQQGTPPKGLYVDIIRLIAESTGSEVSYTWVGDYSEKSIKFAFEHDECDIYPGVPRLEEWGQGFMRVTQPYLNASYALVLPKTEHQSGLATLKGKRVAVQFKTPPQDILAEMDDVTTVTYTTAKEAMEGLAKGEADTAFVWGPTAGYYNKALLHEAYRVIPTRGAGLEWPVAIGVRPGADETYKLVESALPKIRPQIPSLAHQYGLPKGPAITVSLADIKAQSVAARPQISQASFPVSSAKPILVAEASNTGASTSASEKTTTEKSTSTTAQQQSSNREPAQAKSEAELVEEGRMIFNSNCGHCHGPNAEAGDPYMDLPALLREQGKNMDEFFYRTVTNGIPSVGMPTWGGVLSRDQMTKILLFLHAAQKKRFGEVIETSDPKSQE